MIATYIDTVSVLEIRIRCFLKRGLSHCCSIENVWEIRPEIGQKIANGWLLFLALLYYANQN